MSEAIVVKGKTCHFDNHVLSDTWYIHNGGWDEDAEFLGLGGSWQDVAIYWPTRKAAVAFAREQAAKGEGGADQSLLSDKQRELDAVRADRDRLAEENAKLRGASEKLIPCFAKTADGWPLSEDQSRLLAEAVEQATRGPTTSNALILKYARLFAGFGLREFAEHCQILPSDYCSAEKGERDLCPEECERVLNALEAVRKSKSMPPEQPAGERRVRLPPPVEASEGQMTDLTKLVDEGLELCEPTSMDAAERHFATIAFVNTNLRTLLLDHKQRIDREAKFAQLRDELRREAEEDWSATSYQRTSSAIKDGIADRIDDILKGGGQ